MPTSKPAILLSCLFAIVMQLVAPHFFPTLEVNFLIPPIIFALYSFSFASSAWLALLLGCLLDILWLAPRLGFLGCTFLITTFGIYSSRLYFFKDAFSTPLIMTFLFSLIVQLLVSALSILFGMQLPWHPLNFLIIPLQNTLACFLLFLLPRFALRNYNRKYAA